MVSVDTLRCEYRSNPLGLDVPQPRLSWMLRSEDTGVLQTAYRIQVRCGEDIWDSGRVDSDQSIHRTCEGLVLSSRTRYTWRVMVWDNHGGQSDWSEEASFETAFLTSSEWRAQWICAPYDNACLEKSFAVGADITCARAYVTAHGMYEVYLNGMRVGDSYFAPGWTSYHKRLQYQTYDVGALLREGENTLRILLGKGWYKGTLAWEGNDCKYGDTASALLQLHVTYGDGEDVVVTDGSWRTGHGPILSSELYNGETYDARQEEPSDWEPALVTQGDLDVLAAQECEPVRVVRKLTPVALFTTPKGETVLDMGQNMTGYVRVTARGRAGDRIVLRHAEVLDRDGNLYFDNLRSAKQTNTYYLKGEGEETFRPHFTFQGFRYVEVADYPGEVSPADFVGVVLSTDMPQTGWFSCSDPLLNQLQHNIEWSQRGNFVDIPTDCPQRNERLGWTGDAQIFIRTACFLAGAAPFYTKWLRDLKADQQTDGGVPQVIPNIFPERYGASAWADAAVICPWTLYWCYGDTRLLAEQYDSMKRWVTYMRAHGTEAYLYNTEFQFGDWLGLDAPGESYQGATATDLISTAYYAYSAQLVAQAAEVLGYGADAAEFTALHERVVEAFRREFLTPSGRVVSETQTAHVLVLLFDLAPEEMRPGIVKRLVAMLEESGYHLATGFVGTPYLCLALEKAGELDAAYRLLRQTEYPSWLYPITQGATTIWEHWDGIKPDGSFWSPDMNSFNHYAYGAVGDFLYRRVAGLDMLEAGYRKIRFAPRPGGGLTHAEAEHLSPYGPIRSSWQVEGGNIRFRFTVPPNTTAVFAPPAECAAEQREQPLGSGQHEIILPLR